MGTTVWLVWAFLSLPLADPSVDEVLTQARKAADPRTQAAIAAGIEVLEKSLEKNPADARVHALVSELCGELAYYGFKPPYEMYRKAKAAAAKAVELNDASPEAHTALGYVKLYYDWNFPAAETEFKRALELKADFADAHRGYARCLVSMGRMTDALAQSRRFLQLQPESAAARTQQGWNLLVAGEYDAANEQLRKAIEADPTNYVAHLYLGMAQIRGSKPSEGMASLLKADELSGRSMWAVAKLGAGRAIAAGPGEGVEILAEMSSLSTKVFLSAFDMAVLYAALGEKDTAFTWLESAVEERSPRLVELHVDPFLDRVRKDRRFGDMLRQLGLPEKEQP